MSIISSVMNFFLEAWDLVDAHFIAFFSSVVPIYPDQKEYLATSTITNRVWTQIIALGKKKKK